MSIAEATLFVASNSEASQNCLKFISQYKMPIQIVRLDTIEARKRAANGKHFQIKSVPALVILYEDGNTQLFLGQPKINQWVANLVKSSKKQEPRQASNMYGPVQENAYEDDRYPPRDYSRDYQEMEGYDEMEQLRRQPQRKEMPFYGSIAETRMKKPPIIDKGEDIYDERRQRRPPRIVEEEYQEPVYETELPMESFVEEIEEKPVKKTPKKTRSRKSGKKVQEEEIEFIEKPMNPIKMAKEKLNKAASAKSKPLSSKMKGVYNAAKQMEEDMKNSLGYKEDELPRF